MVLKDRVKIHKPLMLKLKGYQVVTGVDDNIGIQTRFGKVAECSN